MKSSDGAVAIDWSDPAIHASVAGALGTAIEDGLDRFWHAVRVYTLDNPVALRAQEVARLLCQHDARCRRLLA